MIVNDCCGVVKKPFDVKSSKKNVILHSSANRFFNILKPIVFAELLNFAAIGMITGAVL